ncbi:unnamed protein product, partial [Cylindrotheca closterium]
RLLRHPLGPWFDPLNNWNWLWSSAQGLFHRQGHGWQHYRHRRSSTRSLQWDYTCSAQLSGRKRPHNEPADDGTCFLPAPFWTQPLPENVCQATVHITPLLGTLALTGIGTESLQPHHDSQPSLLAAWMAASAEVTECVEWTPEEIEIDGDESLLAEALLEDRLCVISDAYKLGLGTAAVQLLSRKGGKERIIVRCQTPGLPDDPSAYRSELIGLLAGIMVVDWLLDYDNRVTPQKAQFDLVSSIREALARSRASWEPSHVYGHLDKATSFLCLSWWSKRNVEVDAWAVAYRHQLEASHQLIAPNARFFTELAALYIGDVKQSRLNPEHIQELVALPALRKRWHERQTITPEAELETDWTSLARAMSSLPTGVQRWTTKHVVVMCGVGKFKVRWSSADSAACPCCGEFEDHLHVPQCMAPSASAEWDRRTATLDQWLDAQVTDPAIKHAILHLLQELILLGFHMGEHRNSVQHSEDNVQLRERSRLVNDGIHSQFDMGPTDLPKVVQRMLAVKRRTVLNKPLVDREEWLKLVRMERTAYRRALAPQRRILHRFFHPAQAP